MGAIPPANSGQGSEAARLMVTPKTGEPRGRPPKAIESDDDVLAIGLAICAQQIWNITENAAFNLAARCFLPGTREFSPPPLGATHNMPSVKFRMALQPGNPVEVSGRTTTLKQKFHRWKNDPQKSTRIAAISTLWQAYFDPDFPDDPTQISEFLNFAEATGERQLGDMIVKHRQVARQKSASKPKR